MLERIAFLFAVTVATVFAESPTCFGTLQELCSPQPPEKTVKTSAAFIDCMHCVGNNFQAVDVGSCANADMTAYCLGQPADLGNGNSGAATYPHHEVPHIGITANRPLIYDCAVRKVALEYATQLAAAPNTARTAADVKMVYDALALERDCKGHTWAKAAAQLEAAKAEQQQRATMHSPAPALEPRRYGLLLYVDANSGSDSNMGTISSPLQTLSFAVQKAKNVPEGARPVKIVLREGVYRSAKTISLVTGAHNNLTITSYDGEHAEITGDKAITTNWKQAGTTPDGSLPIWVADLSSQGDLGDFVGLRYKGGRVTRARYPNSNPELEQANTTYIQSWTNPQNWTAPLPTGTAETVTVADPNRLEDTGAFGYYTIGTGGPCAVYSPPESYWCSNRTSGGGAFPFRVPSGVALQPGTVPGMEDWADPVGDGAVFNVWRPARWSNWMFKTSNYDKDSRNFTFGGGGFQGARGSNFGGDFFIENIRELLDAPNEFFYDKRDSKLYLVFNASAAVDGAAEAAHAAPPAEGFSVPVLKTILEVRAQQDEPLLGLNLINVTFAHAAATYFDPHGVPSGGDWALQRSAAVFFEGVKGLNVEGCTFTRLDGIGLMLSGFARATTIKANKFQWIGDTAMAAWGRTANISTASGVVVEGFDGTEGNQPRGTLVENNYVSELGHYQKQSAAWFQAKAAQTTLRGNVFFNGPRAGINFNDGFGGANIIANNLIFNFCRESSDHGPFNSWDRQPFLTDVANPEAPSLTPAYNVIKNNYLIANYQSSMCVDNDDGSAFYRIHDNVCAYGGHKSDFDGHHKYTYNSLDIFPKKDACVRTMPMFSADGVDAYYNNSCMMLGEGNGQPGAVGAGPYAAFSACQNKTLRYSEQLITLHENTVYLDEDKFGKPMVACSDFLPPWGAALKVDLATWQKMYKTSAINTTVVGTLPTPDTMAAMARAILGLGSGSDAFMTE